MSKSPRHFKTTLYYEHPDWETYAENLDLPYNSPEPHSVWDEVVYFWRVVKAALTTDSMLLTSSSGKFYPELMAAAFLGFLPKRFRPWMAMMGSMWHVEPGLKYQIEKLVLRLADRTIQRYIVQSTEEVSTFPQIWDIDEDKMRRCLYFYTFTEKDLAEPAPPSQDYIFAGGNAHRNYAPLIEAARLLPDQRFIIATNRVVPNDTTPHNVTICEVPHDEFVRLMRVAKIVVVPMKAKLKRAAGQQTYLNAMLLKKPTIVSDGFAVHDHLRHQHNAFIVNGSPESYVETIQWICNPDNAPQVTEICEEAYRVAHDDFSYDHHVKRLLDIMWEVVI